MNYREHDELFCSEVAALAYEEAGIALWAGLSTLSSPGLRSWLASFGVEHFETQEPSDLEYDPQLVVVAEWRDPDVLFNDHLDNAVIDVMLERADQGEMLGYPWYQLPAGRLLKAYSSILNLFGGVGPVPEGMSASSALRHLAFTDRNRRLSEEAHGRAAAFQEERGYVPPYWELVRIAREVLQAES
jgi:hypothetical protein